MEISVLNTKRNFFVFDLDGVILDLMDRFLENMLSAARSAGLKDGHVRAYFDGLWDGTIASKGSFTEQVRAIWPELDECFLAEFVGRVQDVERGNPYPIISGSVYVVSWLKRLRYDVGLCTSNMRAVAEWKCDAAREHPENGDRGLFEEAKYLSLGMFDFISTPDYDSAGTAKPDPQALLYLLEESGARAEDTVFFGDWGPDWQAAREIPGLLFIGVTSGGYSKEAFLKQGVPKEQILGKLADFPHIASFSPKE